MPQKPPAPLLTVRAAADILGVSRHQAYDYIKRWSSGRATYRIDEDALDAFQRRPRIVCRMLVMVTNRSFCYTPFPMSDVKS